MALLIPLAFIIVPVIEIAVFIHLGSEIGVWNTVILIILTAIIGAWLLRSQGLATLHRAQESIQRQVLPVAEVFDGLCLIAAGVLLLTPGFVTDAVGLILFLPLFRAILRTQIWARLVKSENARVWMNAENPASSQSEGLNTIDGDFHEVEPEDSHPDPKPCPNNKKK